MTQGELERIPIGIEKSFSNLEIQIMSDIVYRIKVNGFSTATSNWEISRLQQLGESEENIKKWIQETLEITDAEMDRIFSDEIYGKYYGHSKAYEIYGMKQIPYEENAELQQLVVAIRKQTGDTFRNITTSMGFAIQNPASGDTYYTPLEQFYRETLDSAMYGIESGAFSYQAVLKKTINIMTKSGIRWIDYDSGYHSRVNVAARRALMTGFRQIQGKINEQTARDLHTDSYEVTYHIGARQTHQAWQGKVWTYRELQEVCGLGTVTGLHGANCYHDYNAFIPGVSVRTYTDEQLQQMMEEENTPKEYNGKQYTTYEALQQQRKMESAMRKTRQDIKLLQDGDSDDQTIMLKKARYQGQMQSYKDFSKKMSIPEQMGRVYHDGLKGKFTLTKTEQSRMEIVGSAVKSVAKSGSDGIMKVDAIKGTARYREMRNKQIIEKGISQENRVFASDDFGKFASRIPPIDGYYDVALHGAPKSASFYGEKIGADTLAEIIKLRSDYDGKTPIRLLSCYTGKGEDCFAQRMANKLKVPVMAPDDIIWARSDGTYTVGPTKYKNTGNMVTFLPQNEEHKK